ncbi:hypothetical protein BDV28DRAFT_98193 [Aspergillus coremiiformis]|uniref:Uncharacterized protein n=1 Tax=Aspergillus coremiiformis TaxID=138285 RepID=A0A5N6Z8H0_9EURO|nr:hypothetical protein BDV28DRAFT_98193 [Aspergillus coremiiformis]
MRGSTITETSKRPDLIKSIADAVPPSCIPVVHISAITMTMKYSRHYQHLQRMPPLSIVTANRSKTPRSLSHSLMGILKIGPYQQSEFNRQALNTMTISGDSRFTPHMERSYYVDEDTGNSQDSVPGNTLVQWANNTSQISEFSSLFNTGFRALMLDNPTGIYKYPMLQQNELQSLSRIAPSVFSPGYREVSNQIFRLP